MSENFRQQLEKLPLLLSDHMKLTLLALAAGIAISLPLAIAAARYKPLRWPVLTTASVIQTIPSLALLALMVPLLAAFGFWPAFLALLLYSMLPILRNTVTGIVNVDRAITEAARGIGMTSVQMLFRVELPLAMPVILAGIRTATVWIVGIATLSTPVGQPSLGNFIFAGLQTRNWTAVLFGCISAAALAIVLDVLIGTLEAGAAKRSRTRLIFASIALVAIFAGGLFAPNFVSESSTSSTRPITIGAKTFTEQYILAELIATRLQDFGFDTKKAESLGSTVVFDALVNGDVDCYVDYSGTIWANHMKRDDVRSPHVVLDEMTRWLADTYQVKCLGALGFENAYALAMRRDRANELNIDSISDLANHAANLKIGSDYEFFSRPEWYNLRNTYGLAFAERVSFDSTFMYQAVADGTVDVITAFSSDGRIAAFDLVVLEDDKLAFPPYDAVLLLGPEAADDGAIVDALSPLVGSISVEKMREANYMVDRNTNKKTVAEAAYDLRP